MAIRVQDVSDDRVVVSTLRGHALAGFVRFSTQVLENGVGFEVMPCDSPANVVDWVSMTLGGARLQEANWVTLVTNVAAMAGGDAGKVGMDVRTLTTAEAGEADDWITGIIQHRQAS